MYFENFDVWYLKDWREFKIYSTDKELISLNSRHKRVTVTSLLTCLKYLLNDDDSTRNAANIYHSKYSIILISDCKLPFWGKNINIQEKRHLACIWFMIASSMTEFFSGYFFAWKFSAFWAYLFPFPSMICTKNSLRNCQIREATASQIQVRCLIPW